MTPNNRTEFYQPDKVQRDPEDMTNAEIREELRLVRTRLMLASAFVDFVRFSYSALLTHNVNYLVLGAYKDQSLLDEAAKLKLLVGADLYIEWLARVRHDIKATISRKGLKAIGPKRTPPPHSPPRKPH